MTAKLSEESTRVPQADGQSVSLEPGLPWPSAYRGSQYSIVSDDNFDDAVLKWEHRDLRIFTEPPEGIRRALVLLGKSGGYGSIRITADDEILTKIPAEDYKHVDKAPIDSGWIPVYVGKLSGTISFDEIDTDPRSPRKTQVKVWEGFPFKHGERWSVSTDGKLIWQWRDYRFESAFDHPQLIEAYREYRDTAGRCYVTENNHVWVNIPKDGITNDKEAQIARAVEKWQRAAQNNDDNATLRLVNRRLVATSQQDDPSTGHFPIHLGQLGQFDNGIVPKPIVNEQGYFQAICDYEEVWE